MNFVALIDKGRWEIDWLPSYGMIFECIEDIFFVLKKILELDIHSI